MKSGLLKRISSMVLATGVVVTSMGTDMSVANVQAATKDAPAGAFYVEGHYYQKYNEGITWEEAKAKCEAMGGHLATITSATEQEVINFYNTNGQHLWIGAYQDENNNWRWVNDEKWEYTNWCEGEPSGGDERYATLWSEGYWNDLKLDSWERDGYLCEWDDGDSFSATFHYPFGTPELNGHHYKLYTERLSYKEAKKKCESLGGHLVTVTSKAEQNFLTKTVNTSSEKVWIGGYRDAKHNWYWVTGEAWKYTNWAKGEPNNSTNVINNENCLSMWPQKWNDLNEKSYEQHGFICEWEPEDSGITGKAPTKTKIKSVSNKKKGTLTVTLRKNNSVSGYIVQYSKSATFSKKKTKQVKLGTNKKVTATIKKLKAGSTYYVRVRSTKKVKSTTLYSEWSAVKKVKITK